MGWKELTLSWYRRIAFCRALEHIQRRFATERQPIANRRYSAIQQTPNLRYILRRFGAGLAQQTLRNGYLARGCMTERDRQTEFLSRLLVLADSKAEGDLRARLDDAQHNEKCIRF